MVLIVAVSVLQSDSFRKIQGCLFYWYQNQLIKIQEKEGRQKESKKKEFFGCGKSKLRVELLLFFFHCRGHQLMVNMSQRSIECHSADQDVLGLFTSRTERRRPVKFKFSLERLKS